MALLSTFKKPLIVEIVLLTPVGKSPHTVKEELLKEAANRGLEKETSVLMDVFQNYIRVNTNNEEFAEFVKTNYPVK